MKGSRRRQKQEQRTKVWDLPSNILMGILSGLPVKDLYSCRRVCKSWLTLVSDPYFARLHHSVAPTGVLGLTIPLRDIRLIEFFKSSSSSEDRVHRNVLKFRSSFKHCPGSNKQNLRLSNTCNGLLCYYQPRKWNPFYICNPIINEYVHIPQVKSSRDDSFQVHDFGFGFSQVTNQYKVIRYLESSSSSQVYWVEIHHLSSDSDSWRSVGCTPPSFRNPRSTTHTLNYGPYLNGALHYLLSKGDDGNCLFESICCFDFVDEVFRFVPPPSQFGANEEPIARMSFALLDNSLCIGHCPRETPGRFEVWVMKDYGVKDSWTRVITMAADSVNNIPYHPVIRLDNGEIFMWKLSLVLLSFDSTTGRRKRVETYNPVTEFLHVAIPFVPSLVSLKDIVGEHQFKNLERGRRVRINQKCFEKRSS